MKDFVKGIVLVAMILFVVKQYYSKGIDEGIAQYGCQRYFKYHAPHIFIQDPPTILTNCYSFCEQLERVTWEEYVQRYKEFMRDH